MKTIIVLAFMCSITSNAFCESVSVDQGLYASDKGYNVCVNQCVASCGFGDPCKTPDGVVVWVNSQCLMTCEQNNLIKEAISKGVNVTIGGSK